MSASVEHEDPGQEPQCQEELQRGRGPLTSRCHTYLHCMLTVIATMQSDWSSNVFVMRDHSDHQTLLRWEGVEVWARDYSPPHTHTHNAIWLELQCVCDERSFRPPDAPSLGGCGGLGTRLLPPPPPPPHTHIRKGRVS